MSTTQESRFLLEERNRQLDLLASTSQRLLASNDPEHELEEIFTDISRLIDMEMFYHYRPSDEPRVMTLKLAGGIGEPERIRFATMRFGELLCGRVAEWRQRLIVEDLQHSSHPGSEVLREVGGTSYAGFPLLANGELVGTLAFVSTRRTHLRDGAVQVIQTICDQIALALERSRFQQQLLESYGKLRDSEERLRLAMEAADLGSWEANVQTGEAAWSARHALMQGYAPDDGPFSVEQWRAQLHPEDVDRVLKVMEQARNDGGTFSVEHRTAREPNGEARWISLIGRFFYDESGTAVRSMGVSHDITDRKHAEAALEESEALLRLGQRIGHIGTIAWDLRQDRAQVSPEWEQIHGLTLGSFGANARASWISLVHNDDLAEVDRAASVAIARRGEEARFEYRIVRPDGTVRWVEARMAYTYTPAGEPLTAIGVVIDATERKAWELELEQRVAERTRALSDSARLLAQEMRRREEAQALLAQAQKLEALGQLTGGVAHDFNNLLTAMDGSLQLIQRRTEDERILRHAANARDAAERAKRLTGRLLAFARRQDLSPEPVVIPLLIAEAESLLRQAAGDAIRLTVSLSEDCWTAYVDPHQLEMALLNLVVNARDAMPEGGVITISARNFPEGQADRPPGLPPGELVVVTVKDTGAGMAEEVQARVLEPFFTTKERGKGTGLGLSMVHGFLQQSGGGLTIQSTPGNGTEIQLFLPRSMEGVLTRPNATPEIDRSRHGAATILLVDDDEQVRPTAAALLRELNYAVLEAGDAETAYALAYAADPLHLVITDVVMPGTDGTALAARLRVAWPHLPILFITGHASGANLVDELVLRKPFDLAELAALTLVALGRDQTTR